MKKLKAMIYRDDPKIFIEIEKWQKKKGLLCRTDAVRLLIRKSLKK